MTKHQIVRPCLVALRAEVGPVGICWLECDLLNASSKFHEFQSVQRISANWGHCEHVVRDQSPQISADALDVAGCVASVQAPRSGPSLQVFLP